MIKINQILNLKKNNFYHTPLNVLSLHLKQQFYEASSIKQEQNTKYPQHIILNSAEQFLIIKTCTKNNKYLEKIEHNKYSHFLSNNLSFPLNLNIVAIPKSLIFNMPSPLMSRFSGFMSLCVIPLPCKYLTPQRSCFIYIWADGEGIPISGSTNNVQVFKLPEASNFLKCLSKYHPELQFCITLHILIYFAILKSSLKLHKNMKQCLSRYFSRKKMTKLDTLNKKKWFVLTNSSKFIVYV